MARQGKPHENGARHERRAAGMAMSVENGAAKDKVGGEGKRYAGTDKPENRYSKPGARSESFSCQVVDNESRTSWRRERRETPCRLFDR